MSRHIECPSLRCRSLRAVVSLVALVGSVGAADAAARVAPKSIESYATATTFTAPAKDWPSDRWWDDYGDAQLSQLIDEALAGAPDLKVTEARIRKAQAIAHQSGAALLPSLTAAAAVTEGGFNTNGGPVLTPNGTQGQAGLLFNWEIDIWGKNRAALAAARSDAKAAQAEAAVTRLALSSAIASAYADLTALYADEDTVADAVRVRSETAGLMRGRVGHGLENESAAERAASARDASQAELAAIRESIGLTKNRIAALTGAGPDRGLSIGRPRITVAAFGLPSDLRAELIGRRPDVIAARLHTEAAAKRIKVAHAAYYPNVNLLGLAGVQTLGLSNLLMQGATGGAVGPAVSLPIFDGGRLRGQLRGAEADYDSAVAEYDKTVTQALQDVADATTSSKALSLRLEKTEQAEAEATAAWRVSSNRYRGGLATYLEVLTAEDAMISAQRATADLRTRAFTLDVKLVDALGGGFRSPSPTT
jgi:NodT family efflux transporter outer membrane factor (OMF) lipoprotein